MPGVRSENLLFTDEFTGDFLAMDVHSGEILYRYNGRCAIVGGVITYAVAGKQYVAVVSGMAAGFWMAPPGAMTVTIFALP